jgi:hypothetical protein
MNEQKNRVALIRTAADAATFLVSNHDSRSVLVFRWRRRSPDSWSSIIYPQIAAREDMKNNENMRVHAAFRGYPKPDSR